MNERTFVARAKREIQSFFCLKLWYVRTSINRTRIKWCH